MATTTPNIGLTKPVVTDNFELDVLNDNYDKIDTAAGKIPMNTPFEITAVSSKYTLQLTAGMKFGNICTCSFSIIASSPSEPNNVKVATVPTGFRPVSRTRVCIFATNNWSDYQSGWLDITTNGDITIASKTSTVWFGQAVWVTA